VSKGKLGVVVEYCNCGMVFLSVRWNEGIVVVCVDINRGEMVSKRKSGMVVEYCNCGMVFLPVTLNEGINETWTGR
jgi:hypothetical protein